MTSDMIRTARLVLRRARMSDLSDIHEIMSNPVAMRYWSSHPEFTRLDQTRDWLQAMVQRQSGGDEFVIELGSKVIGKAGAWQLPEIGFYLHPDLWGQGLAFEALSAIIPHLFRAHPVDGLTAEADPRNVASIALLSRLGFAETGRAERTLLWGNDWCDSVCFALPRP